MDDKTLTDITLWAYIVVLTSLVMLNVAAQVQVRLPPGHSALEVEPSLRYFHNRTLQLARVACLLVALTFIAIYARTLWSLAVSIVAILAGWWLNQYGLWGKAVRFRYLLDIITGVGALLIAVTLLGWRASVP